VRSKESYKVFNKGVELCEERVSGTSGEENLGQPSRSWFPGRVHIPKGCSSLNLDLVIMRGDYASLSISFGPIWRLNIQLTHGYQAVEGR